MDEAASTAVERFRQGVVIPAHPLALTESRKLDERYQRALTRYYIASGAGGIAVGVHTTQFALHTLHSDLLRPVLEIAHEEAIRAPACERPILVAGVLGDTQQAVAEAELAASLGYDAVLVSPYAEFDEAQLVERSAEVGAVLPTIGFFLQPKVGGCLLSRDYWRAIASLESTIGIKVAPFSRYHTLDVLSGVAESGRAGEIALYTGNDDDIVGDLLTRHSSANGSALRFVGGLLGQWSVWTSVAVRHLEMAHAAHEGNGAAHAELWGIRTRLTDANAAIFDVAHEFKGCIPGVHEVLRRHGLLRGTWCLDPRESLSTGQIAEIDRIWRRYPDLRDDAFVAEHLDEWLA